MEYRYGMWVIDMFIYHIDMVIVDIDMGYGLMICEMTISMWSSWRILIDIGYIVTLAGTTLKLVMIVELRSNKMLCWSISSLKSFWYPAPAQRSPAAASWWRVMSSGAANFSMLTYRMSPVVDDSSLDT